MNIATYNLRVGGKKRVHWQKMLDDHQVDILLLQETFPHDQHLQTLLEPLPTDRCVFNFVPGLPWGSAVFLAKGSIRRIPVTGFEGWVEGGAVSRVTWPDGTNNELLTFSLHAPSVKDSYANQVNKILDELQRIADGRAMILGGDFNLTVSDGEGAKRPVTNQESEIHKRISEEFRLVNCWKEKHPNEPLNQTLRWSRDKSAVYHCDGIFVPETWRHELVQCEVISGEAWTSLSDHNPVWASFRESK